MNVKFNTAADLRQLQDDAIQSQRAVLSLVDREKDLLEAVKELEQIKDPEKRLDVAAGIIIEAEGLAEIHKTLSDQIDRVRKRIAAVSDKLRSASLDEMVLIKALKLETDHFELAVKSNPPSVKVDDLAKVPKDWRTEPPPIPTWKEWAPDKNSIKAALTNGTKKSIPGVHLESSKRLEINRK
jgi:SpoVK/Ycf46/Vps4 family AAA+-type ATPase